MKTIVNARKSSLTLNHFLTHPARPVLRAYVLLLLTFNRN
jgi:hypothetical protein